LPPPTEVLAAFGAVGEATRLEGGEGNSWRVGDIVLKPDGPSEVLEWLVSSVETVADTGDFRMARHLRSGDGRVVVDGWAATAWVEGTHGSERWDDVLTASRAFHAALASVGLPPADLPWADTPWRTASRVAWNEQPAATDVPAAVTAVLDRLAPVTSVMWAGAPAQVIHGDIGGNVLFADDLGLPPAIIDMSPYVRPAAFADAVAVVDAIAWEAAPITLAFRFGTTVEHGEQLLARAVVFRLIAAATAWPQYPERVATHVDAYQPVLSAIQT
jgi:uncharacterized protein (TIGR02569 family)